MKTTALLVLGSAMFMAVPAHADVFSSQGFSGETTTLDSLPGVNLDAVPGFGSGTENCVETASPAFSRRNGLAEGRATTCRFGNFSITTTGSDRPSALYDTTYGGNPPPWQQGWRP